MALIKGFLASYSDPLLGAVPTVVLFQYNPTEITRVFKVQAPSGAAGSEPTGSARNAVRPAPEDYTVKLEFDATDGLEKGGPVTTVLGMAPRLAALEMLVQPVGSSLLGGLAGALTGGLLGGGGAAIPAGRLPLTLFCWGPGRVTPVGLKSLTIHETAFDELLNPIHATADLSFTVLRLDDLGKDDTLARAAARYYQGARESKAVLQLAQIPELM
ncbi:MAG TPA: hypothetical protein VFQ71_12960 [Gaiellales bacterium]|nr:hypothetical protein [Gaiellales bacterium]